ncbi:MAG: IS5 family transposase [Planctomycetes bacterium]|nr:IS5 family transposase [Planctomycetota bacterium]MBM4117422.1 IS5 family transposase [bacterium]
MRGPDDRHEEFFSYVPLEARVPKDHPLRAIRRLVDAALKELSPRFDAIYAQTGRPSIPPEHLLRALLLQVLFTIRSERQLMEQLDYNLLYRWFVGLRMDDPVWVPTVFSKNRERLLAGDIAAAFLAQILAQAKARDLLSTEHFTVDGTLIEAWASQKSLRPIGSDDKEPSADPGNPTVDFRGEKRSNATHRSTTDPEARLYRKGNGKESKLSYAGHVLMENRSGLAVDGRLTIADGTCEREAALAMVEELPGSHLITVGGDKGYDTRDFVEGLRERLATPHVACNTSRRRSAIDGRTTRHPGYAISQRCRKRVEEIFGWMKTVGGLRKTRHRGRERVGWMFTFTLAVYDVARMARLIGSPAG